MENVQIEDPLWTISLCRLIIRPSFQYIDCMALGKEDSLPAITHFVLDECYASTINFTGTKIETTFPSKWKAEMKKDVNIIAPFYKTSKKKVRDARNNYSFSFVFFKEFLSNG